MRLNLQECEAELLPQVRIVFMLGVLSRRLDLHGWILTDKRVHPPPPTHTGTDALQQGQGERQRDAPALAAHARAEHAGRRGQGKVRQMGGGGV